MGRTPAEAGDVPDHGLMAFREGNREGFLLDDAGEPITEVAGIPKRLRCDRVLFRLDPT